MREEGLTSFPQEMKGCEIHINYIAPEPSFPQEIMGSHEFHTLTNFSHEIT